jgi:DNA repair protein RadC
MDKQHLTNLELMGAAALRDDELLAVLLGISVETARALKKFGLTELGRNNSPLVMETAGVGYAISRKITSFFELVKRLGTEKYKTTPCDSPEAIYDLVGSALQLESREFVQVLMLDTRFNLIKLETIAIGTINEALAHPREIFRPAVLNSAYGIILVHNHPSGDPSPSQADRTMTRRMVEVGTTLGIKVIEHLIVGRNSDKHEPYFSFREMGLL